MLITKHYTLTQNKTIKFKNNINTMRKQTLLKSTLCLLMALVCNVAWAQIDVSTSVETPNHVYALKSAAGYWMTSYTSPTNNETNRGVFAFFADGEDAYKIFSVERQMWVSYTKADSYSDGANKAILVAAQADANAWNVTYVNNYFQIAPYKNDGTAAATYWNWNGGVNAGSNAPDNTNKTIGFYYKGAVAGNNGDNGSRWTLVEVSNYDFRQIVDLSCVLTDQSGYEYTYAYKGIAGRTKPAISGVVGYTCSGEAWEENVYKATINFPVPVRQNVMISPFNSSHIWYFVKDESKVKTTHTVPTLQNKEDYLWVITPALENNSFTFTIKNVATGKYIYTTSTENDVHNDGTITVSETDTKFTLEENKQFKIVGQNLCLSAGSSTSGEKWAGTHQGHNGTKNNVYVANAVTNYILTDANGTIYEGTYDGFTAIAPTIPGAYGHSFTNKVWDGDTFRAIINFDYPVSKEGGVTNPTFLANWVKSGVQAKRWKAVLEDNGYNVKIYQVNSVTPELSELNLWRWAIYPEFADGAFSFVIKNMHTGKYVYVDPTKENAGGSKGYVTLQETGTKFTIIQNGNYKNLAYIKNGGTILKLTTNGGDDNDKYLGSYDGTHEGNHITWPEFTTYTLTTGTNGYASGYTPIAVTVPQGVTVYTGKLITANKASIILNELTDATVIPANTAFVIKGTASTTYTFNKSNTAGTPVANNVLIGSADNVATSSINDGVVYTMQADGTFQKYTGETIPGCNAYIKMPAGTTNTVNILDEADFVNEVADFKQGGVYTFVSSKGWVGATETCANVISTAKAAHNATGLATDPMFQWAVVKSANGNYYLYNLGKQKFMGVESRNNTSVPFSDNPAGKKLSFKQTNSTEYPIMFSTDNAAVVNHNGGYGDGCISWTGGWNNLTDAGNAHQVTLVKTLTAAELHPIANIVEAYDKQLYVITQVEGSWNDNPNTHFGNVTATSTSGTLSAKLKTDPSKVMLDYDGLNETTISFTRAYRGFKFQGFVFDEQKLGESFRLTDELKSRITAETPLVAKFTCTDEVTLFYDDDPFSYRIPAIGKTSTGRLIAVSDYRYSLDDIGRYNFGTANPGIDLVMRYSDDNGKTWSETKTIAKGSCVRGTDDCAYGDAAIAVVGQKVLVMGAAGDVMFGNGSATAHNRAIRIFSEDNGVTWTKQDISETLFLGDDATIKNGYSSFFGSGRLAVDENYNGTGKARIYGALLLKKASGTGNYVIYTDDLGLTWHILGGSQDPVAAQDEPKVEILPSGQILLSVRRGGGRQFNVFTYTDKATNAGSWNTNVNGCNNGGSNTCNGEIYVVDAKKADGSPVKLLLQSQPKGGGGLYDRRDVTIWYKEVDNTNYTSSQIASDWTQGLQVSTQLSAYSTMTLQDDGKIAFFFEEAPCYDDDYAKGYCMVYVPLSISEITIGKYADQNSEAKAVNVNVTDDMGNIYDLDLNIFADDEEAIKDLVKATWSFAEFGASPELTKEGNTYTYTNTVTLPFKVSNNETTVWHNIYWHGSKENELVYLYGGASGDEHVAKKAPGSGIPYGASDYNTAKYADNMNWAIYHAGNFTFTFKNKLTNKFIQVEGVATNSENNGKVQNAKFVEKGATAFEIMKKTANQTYKGDYSLKATVEGVVGYLCNTSASYEWATHYTGNSHEGGWLNFEEAPDFTSLIAEVSNVLSLIGEDLQQYTVTAANTEIATKAKTAMQNSNTVKLNDLNTYKNLMDGATLNLPAAGQFYRIKSCSNGRYLGNTVDDTSDSKTLITVDSNEADPSIIYYFEPGLTNGQYYLMSYANGHYLANPWRIGVGSETIPTTNNETFKQYTEIAEGQRTMYVLKYANGSNNFIKVSEEKTNYSTDKDADDAQWTFEPVTSLPFTFKGAALGFATFCAPVNVQLYEGVVAYIAEIMVGDGNNYKLKMRRIVGDVVPANTPVLLYKEGIDADVTVNFNIDNVECNFTANDLESQNHFYRTIEAETLESGYTYYSLQKGSDDKLGFYLKNYGTLGGFKAWIKITNPNSPQAFTIFFDGDDATGLKEALGLENENVEIYDMSGRRLDKPTKGINVVDGKLVIK